MSNGVLFLLLGLGAIWLAANGRGNAIWNAVTGVNPAPSAGARPPDPGRPVVPPGQAGPNNPPGTA